MNIQQLRQSLKQKWLIYYKQNITWLVKMRIWATYDGLRRPLSGFILATLSVLEPQFDEILAFMLDLNNDPDKIVAALGLNFNPDEELRLIKSEDSIDISQLEDESPDEKHFEDKHLSSAVTASKIALHSLAKTLYSNLSRAEQVAPSFPAATEVVPTRKPELAVAFATKIAPDTPVKTPASDFIKEYQPIGSHSALTMSSEINSKAKTMPSVALATEIKSNASSVRIPVGALLAISTEINSDGKAMRSLAITTEVKNNSKKPNIQPQDVKSKVIPTTNARSLASWVDEFCYGTRNKEKDILA
ncbi:MAG: DUF5331 domain-containing protein [Nostoc sp. DedVER02]|uniref:DUF5331 domain-containing protein n=1 Tax=unclassified Nostoc TaxID=2593658 RepID=UPI002AD3B9D1|nr:MULTISPECIES: DUF5331 domain-containing protein [unclassified Nostoc]MDZ7986738.1 DUF5331 domain-containing protein [Nostoc sp. DedVER02]MDZ8115640.1 DUF5331 domain-containing protein [Nostoc sp. DedVER01b]